MNTVGGLYPSPKPVPSAEEIAQKIQNHSPIPVCLEIDVSPTSILSSAFESAIEACQRLNVRSVRFDHTNLCCRAFHTGCGDAREWTEDGGTGDAIVGLYQAPNFVWTTYGNEVLARREEEARRAREAEGMRNADIPGADEIADRLKKTIDPSITGGISPCPSFSSVENRAVEIPAYVYALLIACCALGFLAGHLLAAALL